MFLHNCAKENHLLPPVGFQVFFFRNPFSHCQFNLLHYNELTNCRCSRKGVANGIRDPSRRGITNNGSVMGANYCHFLHEREMEMKGGNKLSFMLEIRKYKSQTFAEKL